MMSQQATTQQIQNNDVAMHRNKPQLLFQKVMARLSVCIWGRRTGKTEGPMVDFTVNNIFEMPRGNGFLLGSTYTQLLTRTLPPLIAGWEKYGYRENKHYWIRRYADDKLRLPKAYRHPVEPTHYIHWYTGSGIYLVSQDRPGTINGTQGQWLAGDEARFLNKASLDEDMLQTLSGHANLWQDKSCYLSKLFCSDMPRSSKSKWLLDYREQMDDELINEILKVHNEIIVLTEKFETLGESSRKKIRPRLIKLYWYINELRKNAVYFSTASTLDNVHVLGVEAIAELKRELSDVDFFLTILNREIMKIENGFYSLLDEDIHGYHGYDYSYIENKEWNHRAPDQADSRWDKDVDKTQPLTIACDHNNAINTIATLQEVGKEIKLLSTKHVLNPDMMSDMVNLWDNYYQHHPIDDVYYLHDSTSEGGNERSNASIVDDMVKLLTAKGWNVTVVDIGQIPTHHFRYFFWGKLLEGKDKRLPDFRFNKDNNPDWLIAAQQAGTLISVDKQGKSRIKKDKRSEKDKNVLPQHATHYTEAVDIGVYGMLMDRLGEDSSFIGNVYS